MVRDQPHRPLLERGIDLLRHGAHPPGLKQERHQTWGASYSEAHPDEKGTTCAGFLTRAAAYFTSHDVSIERVLTDNHFSYRKSTDFIEAVAAIGARQKFIKPHCPWQNGKVERYNRTLANEWAYVRSYATNQDRLDALAPWVEHYNTERRHTALGGKAPITRLS